MDKIKILMIGDYNSNAGPANVNKEIINNSSNHIVYIKNKKKISKFFELIFKIIFCDCILISAFNLNANLIWRLSKLLNKKIIYLMHGYARYENEINHLHLKPSMLQKEYNILKRCNLILCVSKWYMNWVKNMLPEFENKIFFLNNGVDITKGSANNKMNGKLRISLIGGNRCIKNNGEVCKAIERMINNGKDIKVNIYGKMYNNNEELAKYSFVNIKGKISQEDFFKELKNTDLVILNSEVESFGLSVIEALRYGCDILISQNCGVQSILDCCENDIIHNPHNIEELVEKIDYFFYNSNYHRLISNININECSCQNRANQLIKICKLVMSNYSIDEIKKVIE